MRENRLKIILEHSGQKEQTQVLDSASKRISVSIVIASLVLGSSIMAHAQLEPKFFGIPVLALAGFAVAGVLGFWHLLSGHSSKKLVITGGESAARQRPRTLFLNTVTYWELPFDCGIDFPDSWVGRASCASFEGTQDGYAASFL